MAAFEKLDDELLKDVVGGGGVFRTISTDASSSIVEIKIAADEASPTKVRLKDKTQVYVHDINEGVRNSKDGITWYLIDQPVQGWIDGSSVGLPQKRW